MKEQSELKEQFVEILKTFIINDYARDNFDSGYTYQVPDIIDAMQQAYNLDRPTPPVEIETAENFIRHRMIDEFGHIDPIANFWIETVEAYHAQFTTSSDKIVGVEDLLIRAARYGYDYHATTQFPQLLFDENCKNNFLQYLQSSAQFKPTPTEDKGIEGVREAARQKFIDEVIEEHGEYMKETNTAVEDIYDHGKLHFYEKGAEFGYSWQSQQDKAIPNLSEMDGQLVDKEVEISQLKALLSKVRNFTSSMVEWEDIEKQIDEALKETEE